MISSTVNMSTKYIEDSVIAGFGNYISKPGCYKAPVTHANCYKQRKRYEDAIIDGNIAFIDHYDSVINNIYDWVYLAEDRKLQICYMIAVIKETSWLQPSIDLINQVKTLSALATDLRQCIAILITGIPLPPLIDDY